MALTSPALSASVTIAIGSEITSLDPHYHNLTPNNMVVKHVFESLIGQDENQGLVPSLALSWGPVNETTWEFSLREGVMFSDGTPFTAEDVACSFERAPDVPNSPSSFGTYLSGKTVTIIDDYTVQISTEGPYPLMANDLSTVPIISDSVGCSGATDEFNALTAAVGTGPYIFTNYVPGDRVVMERNPNYWGGSAEWDEVTIRMITSDPSRVAALLAGDVDMISQVPTVDIPALAENDDFVLAQGTSNRVIYLHMDHFRDDSPFVTANGGGDIVNPLRDARVRRAMSMAISRVAIQERVMEGLSIPAGQLLPDGFFGVSDNLEPLEYDPEGAQALLEEAGYADGFELTIHTPNGRYINDTRIGEAIAQMLTRIGIRTSLEAVPTNVFFSRASRGGPNETPEFSFILAGWGAGSGEASSPLRSLIHTHDPANGFGASNRGRYSNPAVDAIVEEALVTVDDAQRAALLAEATEMAIEDVAIIPVHYQVNTWAARTGLTYTPRTDEYTLITGLTAN
jgi:peptide/nickel transport system substrate-binding protein